MPNFFDMGSHDPMEDVRFHLTACPKFPQRCDHGFQLVIPGDGRSAFARVCAPFPDPRYRVRVVSGPRETPYSAGEMTLEEADALMARWQETRINYIVEDVLSEPVLSTATDELFI